jgi:hypothetical protein
MTTVSQQAKVARKFEANDSASSAIVARSRDDAFPVAISPLTAVQSPRHEAKVSPRDALADVASLDQRRDSKSLQFWHATLSRMRQCWWAMKGSGCSFLAGVLVMRL